MATFVDPVVRHAYKNSMIEAQIFGAKEFEGKKKKKSSKVNETETT